VGVAVVILVLALAAFGPFVAWLAWRFRQERAAHEFVESVFNRVGDPLFVKDHQHRLVLVNDAECKLAGRPRARLLGRTDYEFFPKQEVDTFWRQDDQVLTTGREDVNEEVITDARGAVRTIVTKKTLHVSREGQPYVIGVIRDITDRKRVEEDARALNDELQRLRVEWASVVAHDLRQPLGAISLGAKILGRTIDDPNLRKVIDRIRSAADRLDRMVGDLMDLSRVDARRLELQKQPVDVLGLVRECIERMSLEVPDRPFSVRSPDDLRTVEADHDRLAQVIENLLTNAVKHGHAGTPIVIEVGCDDLEIAVAVINQGNPISAEELSRLFQRFQRTSSAKLRGIEGTGLGLYITRGLVEAHGGRIDAECTPAGTITFRFTLPFACGVNP
jgi:PAS domain S-box-containing protein